MTAPKALTAPGTVRPSARLRGRLRLPSDKSIGHRALIANALADGEAMVELRHPGADLLGTVGCLQSLGVQVTLRGGSGDGGGVRGDLQVELRGDGWGAPLATLACGNSATTMRLLAGALAGQTIGASLDGDASLRARPMERVAEALRAMGAEVDTTGGRPPLRVGGRRSLRALEHRLPVASAQLIGAICLAGLSARGTTRLVSPGPTRDHTERLLAWMGVPISRDDNVTMLHGPARPVARSLRVGADPSSAAAWLVAGTLHPDAELELSDVALNPTRLGIVGALREMGAEIEVVERHGHGPEPIGDLRVRSAPRLGPLLVEGDRAAALIDELPLLGVAMAAAGGTSVLRDAGELRLKESDRISTTVAGLAAIGARVEELPDGWRIRRGAPRDGAIPIATRGDHRIAIAFAVAAAAGVACEVLLDDPACVSVSYPTFWDDLAVVTA